MASQWSQTGVHQRSYLANKLRSRFQQAIGNGDEARGIQYRGPEPGFKVEFSGKGPGGEQPEEIKTESLGNQTVEGVLVEGKRITRTIPAGQIGNSQPIQIISEVGASLDIKVTVM